MVSLGLVAFRHQCWFVFFVYIGCYLIEKLKNKWEHDRVYYVLWQKCSPWSHVAKMGVARRVANYYKSVNRTEWKLP